MVGKTESDLIMIAPFGLSAPENAWILQPTASLPRALRCYRSFNGAVLLEPITCIVPDVLPLPSVRLRPRDLEPKSGSRRSSDCDRWSPGVSTAPWRRDLPCRVQTRRERVDRCLES